MSVERYKRSLSLLKQKYDTVQQQVDTLSSNQRKLQLRNSIIASWCDAFSALLTAQLSDKSVADRNVDALADFLVEESQLLQQLVPDDADAAVVAVQCEPSLKQLLRRPVVADAEHMSLEELAGHYTKAVMDSSILLHGWDWQLGNRANIAEQLADIWKSYVHIVVSIALVGRPDVLGGLVVLDLRTMEASAAADLQAQQYIDLVPHLQLTDDQVETLVIGTEAASSLLAGLQQQRQQLQAEVAAFDSSTSSSASCSTDVNSRVSDIWDRVRPGSSSRQQQLEEQQQRLERVERMLQKEHMFRMVIAMWFGDCLGHVKCAKLSCMCYPFPTRPLVMCRVIKSWAEARDRTARGDGGVSGCAKQGAGASGAM